MNKTYLYISIVAAVIIGITTALYFSTLTETDTMNDWKQKMNNTPGVIIDVRTQGEYDEGHLADVDLHYDFNSGEFERKIDDLDQDKTYYLYCRTGNRSGQAAEIMKKRGFENVHNIGGFDDLANAGFETK